MSKQSSKQRYEQLKEWLESYSKKRKPKQKATNNSRLEYYQQRGVE